MDIDRGIQLKLGKCGIVNVTTNDEIFLASLTTMVIQNQKISSLVNSQSFLGEVGPSESSLLMMVLPISLLIVIIPVVFFLIGKSYIFIGVFGLSESLANVYAAAVAVLLLHVLLGLFIYRAIKFGEKKPDKLD
ncbi:Vacuolar ATPase assembly integral membrane protein Vma21 [Trinorchestia longiramus]|nr:Vacuolar ATPase assembly integral membrane protein Vma21 [Trinorchestia longiramus]